MLELCLCIFGLEFIISSISFLLSNRQRALFVDSDVPLGHNTRNISIHLVLFCPAIQRLNKRVGTEQGWEDTFPKCSAGEHDLRLPQGLRWGQAAVHHHAAHLCSPLHTPSWVWDLSQAQCGYRTWCFMSAAPDAATRIAKHQQRSITRSRNLRLGQ